MSPLPFGEKPHIPVDGERPNHLVINSILPAAVPSWVSLSQIIEQTWWVSGEPVAQRKTMEEITAELVRLGKLTRIEPPQYLT